MRHGLYHRPHQLVFSWMPRTDYICKFFVVFTAYVKSPIIWIHFHTWIMDFSALYLKLLELGFHPFQFLFILLTKVYVWPNGFAFWNTSFCIKETSDEINDFFLCLYWHVFQCRFGKFYHKNMRFFPSWYTHALWPSLWSIFATKSTYFFSFWESLYVYFLSVASCNAPFM